MSGSAWRHDHPEPPGVLLLNLGTPEAPTPAALRRYLAEFLWDPRVVEMPRPLWWLILHGVILRTRPRRSAAAYARIWTGHGSPLLLHARTQRAGLEERLRARWPGARVVLGMRYGRPAVAEALAELREAGVRRLLVLPLYPQYAAATTASAFDAVTGELRRWRWLPELRFVNHYHDDPGYIAALAASVRDYQAGHGEPDHLLMSFHGIPMATFLAGDPYYCECQKTARLLARELGLEEGRWTVSFQSRLGPKEWLRPYTDRTLRRLAREGVKRVQVICPGFSADCLETLEEIAMENREVFMAAGGREYGYIPALNGRADHLDALAGLVERHVEGWWPGGDPAAAATERRRHLASALAAGRLGIPCPEAEATEGKPDQR